MYAGLFGQPHSCFLRRPLIVAAIWATVAAIQLRIQNCCMLCCQLPPPLLQDGRASRMAHQVTRADILIRPRLVNTIWATVDDGYLYTVLLLSYRRDRIN